MILGALFIPLFVSMVLVYLFANVADFAANGLFR